MEMVVLSVGLAAPLNAGELAGAAEVELNDHRFCATRDFHPLETTRSGVYVCGSFAEPKDIPDSVIQASGAAAKALSLLKEARGTLIRTKEYPRRGYCRRGRAPDRRLRLPLRLNIAGTVNVKAVVTMR